MHLLVMALLSSTLCAAVPVDWPANGRTQREEHFSPLTKINAGNVGALGLAWQFDDFVVRGRTHRGNEASPLFTDGVLYFSGPWSVVYAVDARTGRLRWRYDPHVAGQWAGHGCCDVVNRGVALWHGRVYVATFDGFLVALDARDGREQWRVDTFTDRTSMNYSITGAPRIAGRNVLIGNGGAEMGARGYVSAFDLETGRLTWRFFTVPGDPAKGPDEDSAVTLARRTWSPESRWDLGGGGTAWDSMVYDAQLDLVYVGTGNGCPHPVWTRSPGGGDNLYLSSIVALDAQTGTLRWHYQTTPGDSWDYTATQNIILADLKIDGKMRQVLMQAPKNGFFYVLDRVTGELLSADPYTRVTWADRVDLTSGRPVMSTQADFSTESKLIWPSQAGGHNWMPMAFSPATGLVYIPTLEMPMNFGVTPGAEVRFRPGANNEGDVVSVPAQSIPQLATVLKAWDPVARRTVWQAPAGPFWGGGALSTAGGVVFAGAADGSFTAYDARSGKVLRRILTGIGIMAAPITYEVDGTQYVAVLAGIGGAISAVGYPPGSAAAKVQNRERLFVFKLHGATVRPPARRAREVLQPVPVLAIEPGPTPAMVARGQALFGAWCAACHSFRGTPNAYPNLWNLSPAVHEALQAIVLEGALAPVGMPSFAGSLSPADVRAIQQFIVTDEIALRQMPLPEAR